MRLIARRFGVGSVAALAVVVATEVAMASHFSLWNSDILRFKLVVLVLVAVLLALHVLTPTSRVVSYGVAAASLLVVWLGVKFTYG
jgi:hypothetical protein